MDLDTVLTKNADAAYRLYDGQATVVLPTESKVHVINEIGSAVWDRIDGVKTLGRILEEIVNEYDVERAQAEADMFEFAASLKSERMVS